MPLRQQKSLPKCFVIKRTTEMNLTKRQLNILTVALTNFYDEVCKTGTTHEMKQDIMGLCKLVNDEYAKSFAETL